MFYEMIDQRIKKDIPYKLYSIDRKIDVYLNLYRVLHILLKSVEKINDVRVLDIFESEVFRLMKLEMREDIDKCENEINRLSEIMEFSDEDIDQDIVDNLLANIEAAGIDGSYHKIIGHDKFALEDVEKIKMYLLHNELYCSQMKALKDIKNNKYISTCERKIIYYILDGLSSQIMDNYDEMEYIMQWLVQWDYRFRRELKDSIDDSNIETSKALKTGNSYRKTDDSKTKSQNKILYPIRNHNTVDYLKTEVLDLRKWKKGMWLKRRYDKYFASYDPYNSDYIFNYQALYNGIYRYSYRKQIDVYLTAFRSFRIRAQALDKRIHENDLNVFEDHITRYYFFKNLVEYYECEFNAINVFLTKVNNTGFYDKQLTNDLKTKISRYMYLDMYYIDSGQLNIKEQRKDLKQRVYQNFCAEKDGYKYNSNMLASSFDSDQNPHNPKKLEYIRLLIAKHNTETLEIEALLEYNRTLRSSKKLDSRYDKIFSKSLICKKTSEVLLTDEEIYRCYNRLPDDYPGKKDIMKLMEKSAIAHTKDEEKEKVIDDRFLSNIDETDYEYGKED